MKPPYPANVKLYKDGQCKNFSNIMSHTLADDELPGADRGRAVNLIEQALADGWWWTREGQPASAACHFKAAAMYAEVAIAAGEAALSLPGGIADEVEKRESAVDVALGDNPEPVEPAKPRRSSKR